MSWDEWMRRRFRMYIWKQWKKPRTKVANLRKLGIPADKAYQWGNSRLGCWRIAGSPVLKCSITNERLAAAGYFSILNYYESLHLCCWTAVYRSVRTVVWEVGYLFERASYSIKTSDRGILDLVGRHFTTWSVREFTPILHPCGMEKHGFVWNYMRGWK